MCERSIVKEYKLCDDVWGIVKDYLGINGGIRLTIPKLLSDMWFIRVHSRILLDTVLYNTFSEGFSRISVIDSNEAKKSKLIKTIYTKYRLLNRYEKEIICERLEALLPPKWMHPSLQNL